MDHFEAAFFYGDFTELHLAAQAILLELYGDDVPQDKFFDLEQPL